MKIISTGYISSSYENAIRKENPFFHTLYALHVFLALPFLRIRHKLIMLMEKQIAIVNQENSLSAWITKSNLDMFNI